MCVICPNQSQCAAASANPFLAPDIQATIALLFRPHLLIAQTFCFVQTRRSSGSHRFATPACIGWPAGWLVGLLVGCTGIGTGIGTGSMVDTGWHRDWHRLHWSVAIGTGIGTGWHCIGWHRLHWSVARAHAGARMHSRSHARPHSRSRR